MFTKYVHNRQSCLTEAEADYVYKQVEQDKGISPLKMYYKNVHSISGGNSSDTHIHSEVADD